MKVRFEIEVAEVFEEMVPFNDKVFVGATGKSFLHKDHLTGNMTILYCNRGIDEEHKNADIWHLMLPINAKIIDGEEVEVDPIVELRLLMEQSHEALLNQIKESCEVVLNTIDQRGTVVTEGISEETLLAALRIVTNGKSE